MPALVALVALLLLPAGPFAPESQAARKHAYPSKSGIYAMTSEGPVELKVSGERNDVELAIGLQMYYSPESFGRIPAVDSVRSFYVSAMGWAPKDVYMVVGRDRLTNSLDKYQRLNSRVVSRGVLAFEILSADLESPEFVARTIRRLAPAGVGDADLEAYLVLELRSQAGLNDRAYPVRIRLPKD
jgi:hypothetical protein